MSKKKQMPKEKPIEDLDATSLNLVRLAVKAKKRAYAPYSKYNVGAVIKDAKGKIYSGCNVENASYPASICAERTAITKMVSKGGKQVKTVVVAASSEEPVFPCGMCLQVIQEFGRDARVIAVNRRGTLYLEAKMSELFPFAFSPDKLST